MPEKLLYALAQFDDETSRKMDRIDATLKQVGFVGAQTQNIPHHITLASFEPAREKEIQRHLQSVCGNTKSFDLRFSHIGLFGLKVMFYAPDVNRELLELYRMVSGDMDNKNGWTAHATILIDEPDVILKALPIVAEQFQSFESSITSVSLYEFWPARFVSEYRLG